LLFGSVSAAECPGGMGAPLARAQGARGRTNGWATWGERSSYSMQAARLSPKTPSA